MDEVDILIKDYEFRYQEIQNNIGLCWNIINVFLLLCAAIIGGSYLIEDGRYTLYLLLPILIIFMGLLIMMQVTGMGSCAFRCQEIEDRIKTYFNDDSTLLNWEHEFGGYNLFNKDSEKKNQYFFVATIFVILIIAGYFLVCIVALYYNKDYLSYNLKIIISIGYVFLLFIGLLVSYYHGVVNNPIKKKMKKDRPKKDTGEKSAAR